MIERQCEDYDRWAAWSPAVGEALERYHQGCRRPGTMRLLCRGYILLTRLGTLGNHVYGDLSKIPGIRQDALTEFGVCRCTQCGAWHNRWESPCWACRSSLLEELIPTDVEAVPLDTQGMFDRI